MSKFRISQFVLAASALILSACADASRSAVTAPEYTLARDVNGHLIAVGNSATWFFKGTVYSANVPGVQVGDVVQGSIAFTILTDDIWSDDPCASYRGTRATATWTVNGITKSLSSDLGHAVSYTTCNGGREWSWLILNARQNTEAAQIEVRNPADNDDFPLTPPPANVWPNVFSNWDWVANTWMAAILTDLYVGPQTKADCMNGGWSKFGFKNQGQCVRYIETGKDSR